MDKSYPISKIFDIESLIQSFNIEVIGPATYVRGKDAGIDCLDNDGTLIQ